MDGAASLRSETGSLGCFSLNGKGCGEGYDGDLEDHEGVDKENVESFFTTLHNTLSHSLK